MRFLKTSAFGSALLFCRFYPETWEHFLLHSRFRFKKKYGIFWGTPRGQNRVISGVFRSNIITGCYLSLCHAFQYWDTLWKFRRKKKKNWEETSGSEKISVFFRLFSATKKVLLRLPSKNRNRSPCCKVWNRLIAFYMCKFFQRTSLTWKKKNSA